MSDVVDFAKINTTLRTVLNALGGIPGALTQDALQPEFYPQVGRDLLGNGELGTSTRARVTFEVLSEVGTHWDEWRTEYDPSVQIPGDTFVPDPSKPDLRLGAVVYDSSGNREITVQVKVESWDVRDGMAAQSYVARMRTRLYLPTIGDAFNEAGVSIQNITSSQSVSYDDEDGNRVSAFIFEIIFNAADSAQDDPVTTIEILDPSFEIEAQF